MFRDAFGLCVSEGALMNMFIRSHARFKIEAEKTKAVLRAARVVEETMGGHRPHVWLSDRYSAQQSHGERHQTCLAHLARDAAFALEHGLDDRAGSGNLHRTISGFSA